ncbi:MAG: glycoside hydrolase family 3 protein [Clostridia bacterium]|nr:glycoside hydrolase family 3 protein [Clostridia bacterium]
MKNFIATILSTIMMFSGCGANDVQTPTDIPPEEPTQAVADINEVKAEELLSAMTLEEKICQMMFVTPESITGVGEVIQAGEATRAALAKYPVGGIIYFSKNIKSREQVISMINATQSYSKIPLFIGVDEEGGRVARVASNPNMGTTKIKPMRQVYTSDEAYKIGQTLGSELSALKFNLDFAPVADVVLSDKNSEIGDRGFNGGTWAVGELVSAVVKGLEENKVCSVLKHFPGHGSTTVDSHTGYSASYRTIEELRECEFMPFKKGIEAGSDFVMVSHMTLVNVVKDKLPSSLSYEIVTGYLKGELGFEGIAITDALNMGAIAKNYANSTAAVYAIKAGIDMLLMPPGVEEAKQAILTAVTSGEITEERINESVKKILKIKIEKGIIE